MSIRLIEEVASLQRRIQELNDDLQRKDLEIGELRAALERIREYTQEHGGAAKTLKEIRSALQGGEQGGEGPTDEEINASLRKAFPGW